LISENCKYNLWDLGHFYDIEISSPIDSQALNDRNGVVHLVTPLFPMRSLEENDAIFANYYT
jgi:hypothetical protein